MNAFNEPSLDINVEEKIKRSVFIADLKACHNEAEIKEFLSNIIAAHKNATHHCRAYVLISDLGDENNCVEYSSDDGEPSGTAGKPILMAIKHNNIFNVMIIVTRYFGGIKLGTRGLIDAYKGVAEKALSQCAPVLKFVTRNIKINLQYNSLGLINKLFQAHSALNIKSDFAQDIFFSGDVPVENYDSIKNKLDELNLRGIIKYV